MAIQTVIITIIAVAYSRFLKSVLRKFQEIDAAVAAGEMSENVAELARVEEMFASLSATFASFGGVCFSFLVG